MPRLPCVVLLALCAASCGRDDASVAPRDPGDAGTTTMDAGLSGYGDGVCTDREFDEGNEAIEVSRGLAAGGPSLVSDYVARNRARLDGIWADCTARLCPVVAQIFEECSANFVDPDHDEDAGPPPGNPCGTTPPECEPYL